MYNEANNNTKWKSTQTPLMPPCVSIYTWLNMDLSGSPIIKFNYLSFLLLVSKWIFLKYYDLLVILLLKTFNDSSFSTQESRKKFLSMEFKTFYNYGIQSTFSLITHIPANWLLAVLFLCMSPIVFCNLFMWLNLPRMYSPSICPFFIQGSGYTLSSPWNIC